MTVRLYYGEALATYGFGQGHPFGADRLAAFWRETCRQGLDKRAQIATPIRASGTELALFHGVEYIARVRRQSVSGAGYLDYGDTPAFPGVFEAACDVVGTTLDAVAQSVSGTAPRGFVPIAGLHHARRESAAGFCVFNDIGVAIEVLRDRHGIRRIAVVDIDAHHGDGVYYSYDEDSEVFIADVHEDGRHLYPGTGAADESGTGAARGTKLNVPMPPGADDRAFLAQWPRVEEFIRAARPEIILLQAGADSLAGDPLTHLCYSPAAHAHAARALARLADEFCDGRIVAMGGGGYNRDNLALAWNAVLTSFLDA